MKQFGEKLSVHSDLADFKVRQLKDSIHQIAQENDYMPAPK